MIRSINASPLTSKRPFGISVLIGTIRIPNPAARITARCGVFCLNSVIAFTVGRIESSMYSNFISSFSDRLTTPKEWPDTSASIR